MDKNSLAMAANAWSAAANDLGIRATAPFRIPTDTSGERFAAAYLPDFGSMQGTIVDWGFRPDFSGDNEVRRFAEENSMYYSIVSFDRYRSYDRDMFLEALSDWGYYGNVPLPWLKTPLAKSTTG
jgi:hypothetical protein